MREDACTIKKPKMIELYGEVKDEGVYVNLRGTDLQYYGVQKEGGKAGWYSWTVAHPHDPQLGGTG